MRLTALAISAAAAASMVLAPRVLVAQTDYYNTDRGRPVEVEDAYPTERYAFELKLAPVRLERVQGGRYNWGLEPEIAYGILPRTQLELGAPIAFIDQAGAGTRSGLAGLELSVLHNLNVETRTLPALALRADLLAPVGSLAPNRAYPSLTAIATRTYRWARFHLNAQYTFGSRLGGTAESGGAAFGEGAVELSRWLAGVAVDRTFPLRAMLVTAEVFAREPLHTDASVEYNAGGGVRYQVSPSWALDAGVGRRLTGDNRAWYLTFGTSYAFGVPWLIPGRGR